MLVVEHATAQINAVVDRIRHQRSDQEEDRVTHDELLSLHLLLTVDGVTLRVFPMGCFSECGPVHTTPSKPRPEAIPLKLL